MYSPSFCVHAQAPWYSSSISHHAHPSGTAPTPHLPPAFTSPAQRTSRHLPVLLLCGRTLWPLNCCRGQQNVAPPKSWCTSSAQACALIRSVWP
uniref:Uncharacterized protein n=1 Tax=Gopherus evgoodei TaxID=1825980 RepID=A0A8C4Y8Q9_9SAUR